MDADLISELRKKALPPKSLDRAHGLAIVTYVGNDVQERSTRALIKSLRELGGKYREAKVYVLLADPAHFPAESLESDNVILLPLEADTDLQTYPLAIKAFAAAQAEKIVKNEVSSLAWFDPATLVLGSLDELDLDGTYGVAIRPVSLVNTIGIPPGEKANDYWSPIYKELELDYRRLPAYETVVDGKPIQPYFNCEIFSVDPSLGIFSGWAHLLTKLLKDEAYQKNVCTTFLRRLFLHQAVLSGVIMSKVKPSDIKPLSIKTGYPFNQHEQLAVHKQVRSLNELSAVIFDYQWEKESDWMEKIPAQGKLKIWLTEAYADYKK